MFVEKIILKTVNIKRLLQLPLRDTLEIPGYGFLVVNWIKIPGSGFWLCNQLKSLL